MQYRFLAVWIRIRAHLKIRLMLLLLNTILCTIYVTVCSRSLDHFYIVSCYIEMNKTYSTIFLKLWKKFPPKMWPLSSMKGGKALVAGPPKKMNFFAAFLTRVCHCQTTKRILGKKIYFLVAVCHVCVDVQSLFFFFQMR